MGSPITSGLVDGSKVMTYKCCNFIGLAGPVLFTAITDLKPKQCLLLSDWLKVLTVCFRLFVMSRTTRFKSDRLQNLDFFGVICHNMTGMVEVRTFT